MPYHQQLQQNLNQIAQICQQLSQNEQVNVTKLEQMVQAERTASQQLQQCVQLCHQAVQQMQQLSGQFTGQFSQYGATAGTGAGMYGNWSNIPINTSSAFIGGQGGQSSNFAASRQFQATGQSVFNTNKDLGQ